MKPSDLIFQECLAARNDCALFDRFEFGIIEVRGEDRTAFLHRLLSNDIQALKAGQGAYACLLTSQAKVIADVNVLCFKDHFLLITDRQIKDKLFRALDQMVIMDRVTLADRTEEFDFRSLHGPRAKEIVQQIFTDQALPERGLEHAELQKESQTCICIRVNFIGEEGFGFMVSKSKTPFWKHLLWKNKTRGFKKISPEAFEILRVEAGIPRCGIDFDESCLLPEAGLLNAVSHTKGCFPGQEVLARIESRGHINRKLTGLELKGTEVPKKNSLLTKNGKEAGFVTSAVFSPFLKKTIALAYVQREFWKAGSEVVMETSNVQIPARVKPLPFYSGPADEPS